MERYNGHPIYGDAIPVVGEEERKEREMTFKEWLPKFCLVFILPGLVAYILFADQRVDGLPLRIVWWWIVFIPAWFVWAFFIFYILDPRKGR